MFIHKQRDLHFLNGHPFLSSVFEGRGKIGLHRQGEIFFFFPIVLSLHRGKHNHFFYIYITLTISHVDDKLGAALNDKLLIKFK